MLRLKLQHVSSWGRAGFPYHTRKFAGKAFKYIFHLISFIFSSQYIDSLPANLKVYELFAITVFIYFSVIIPKTLGTWVLFGSSTMWHKNTEGIPQVGWLNSICCLWKTPAKSVLSRRKRGNDFNSTPTWRGLHGCTNNFIICLRISFLSLLVVLLSSSCVWTAWPVDDNDEKALEPWQMV